MESINIPEGVTSIGERTFSGCENLTSINMPNGVTNIGTFAFSDCRNLTSINIPEGVTSIEGSAFSGCQKLTSIKIPASVTSMGQNAFWSWASSQTSDCSAFYEDELPDGWNADWRGECNAQIIWKQ